MKTGKFMLDTDILSALMKGEGLVVSRARAYLRNHKKLSFSSITRYEVLKGLKSKGANRQARAFDVFCEECEIMPVNNDVAERASSVFADLSARGETIGDADILIAATALEKGMGLVTNNENHFHRIKGLKIDNWLKR